MSSTQPQWQWDSLQQKHYYYSEEERCLIYEGGKRIPQHSATVEAAGYQGYVRAGGYTAQSPVYLKVVHDAEVSSGPLFDKFENQLHRINPKKEGISLLVCQHVLRLSRECLEPWKHRHIDPYTGSPSLCLYWKQGEEEPALIVDLRDVYMSTHDLKSILKEASANYRSYLSSRIPRSNHHLLSWDNLYAAELKHYNWLQMYNIWVSKEAIEGPGLYFVSGITCPSCNRWSKPGNNCSRCSWPLKDEIQVKGLHAEGIAEVAGGGVGGLAIGLTIASYLLLGLLAQA